MYTYLCLSIYLSIYLFIYLSIYLNIYGHGREEIERGVQVRMKYEVRNMECGQERGKCCDIFPLQGIAPIFFGRNCSDLLSQILLRSLSAWTMLTHRRFTICSDVSLKNFDIEIRAFRQKCSDLPLRSTTCSDLHVKIFNMDLGANARF